MKGKRVLSLALAALMTLSLLVVPQRPSALPT